MSVVLHVIGFFVVPPVGHSLIEPSDRELWIRQQRLYRSLRIRIPESLYVASAGPSAPKLEPKPKPAPRRKPVRPKPPEAAAAEAQQGGRGQQRRDFELPPLPVKIQTPDTMLQPQFSAALLPPSAVQLPEVFFWSPRTEPEALKPFVDPGHVEKPSVPRLLDAMPKLEQPVTEPAPVTMTALPDSASVIRSIFTPSLPLKTSEPESSTPQTGISGESSSGDPTTLLSLALDPQNMHEYLSVPPGNQLGHLPEGGPAGVITGSAPGAGSTAVGSGSGDGNSAEGTATGDGSSGFGAGLRAAALAAANATRIVHPASGVFDVVVESAGLDGFPESAGVLSGRPIYSVYVSAGAPKDWILQYCVPAVDDRTVVNAGSVVRLSAPNKISAPWPLLTLRPALSQRPGHYVMVYGFITEAGRFQDLRVLGNTQPYEAELAITVLYEWQFRPANRNGVPLRVEVLLAIPAE